jgi:excisionase family DNA binding protein
MADWTLEQAQEDLAVGESHLRALVRENRIPHYRVGKLIRFNPETLRAWKAAGGTVEGAAPPQPIAVTGRLMVHPPRRAVEARRQRQRAVLPWTALDETGGA